MPFLQFSWDAFVASVDAGYAHASIPQAQWHYLYFWLESESQRTGSLCRAIGLANRDVHAKACVRCYSSVIHIQSILTTSSALTNMTVPENSSLMVQNPCSRRKCFPTCPIQGFLIMSTLLPLVVFQGSRYHGLMEICVGLLFLTTDTTTSLSSGGIFWLATGTVFAVSPFKLACGDDAGMPKTRHGMHCSPSTPCIFSSKSQCVRAYSG